MYPLPQPLAHALTLCIVVEILDICICLIAIIILFKFKVILLIRSVLHHELSVGEKDLACSVRIHVTGHSHHRRRPTLWSSLLAVGRFLRAPPGCRSFSLSAARFSSAAGCDACMTVPPMVKETGDRYDNNQAVSNHEKAVLKLMNARSTFFSPPRPEKKQSSSTSRFSIPAFSSTRSISLRSRKESINSSQPSWTGERDLALFSERGGRSK